MRKLIQPFSGQRTDQESVVRFALRPSRASTLTLAASVLGLAARVRVELLGGRRAKQRPYS